MRAIRRLGAQFVAFLSGAVLATGLGIVGPGLIADSPPERYWMVLLSGLLVILGGLVAGWGSTVAGDIEVLEVHESTPAARRAVWDAEGGRLRLLFGLSIALAALGLGLLPLRLALTGWDRPRAEACVVEVRDGGLVLGSRCRRGRALHGH